MSPVLLKRRFLLQATAMMVASAMVPRSSFASSKPLEVSASEPLAGAASKPLEIVATTGMIADVVRVVGGDLVNVSQLMGEGVDPHLYRVTQSDIRRLASADAVFWNGLHLEAQLEDFLARLGERKPIFALGEAVPLGALTPDGETREGRKISDPHIWMDPMLWRYVVGAATTALVALSPENAARFTQNATNYSKKLDQLHAFGQVLMGSIPQTARVLVTAHDAFGYFGKAYGMEVAAVQGISTESEAGLKAIEELVKIIVSRKVKAVFAETSVSDRSVRALIEGAAAQGWDVMLGDRLFSDAMGEAGTPEGTYLGMIEHNMTAITQGLGGTVPEGGFTAWSKDML